MNVTLGAFTATPAIRAAVNAVLDSGRLSYGPVSREYEQRFAVMHGVRYGVASNSGTSSLVVALQALKEMHDWHDGDEVIVPALTFVASVNAILHNRLTPVLVDVDPVTYNIDMRKAEREYTKRTRCIMPVHLFGQPANMKMVRASADNFGLAIVQDSCEAMLVTHRGMPVATYGDVACFSTYAAHLLVTGVGGMAATDDHRLALTMRSLVNHGIDLAELPTGEEYDPTFLARKFRFNRIGHSFRVTELEAAIGLAQLDGLADAIRRRVFNARYLTQRLQPLIDRLQLPVVQEYSTHSFMVYPMVLRTGDKRPFMAHLQAAGIECREMVPLTCQPCYDFNEADYPVAANVNRRGVYVGCHQDLTQEHIDYMAEVIERYFQDGRKTHIRERAQMAGLPVLG